MKNVNPKKKLGQHFLIDLNIAKKISETLKFENYDEVLEIGPGMGVLTRFILHKTTPYVVEIDSESVQYLNDNFIELKDKIIEEDFLKLDLKNIFNKPFAVIGNFPYNISSQIVFKIIENRKLIPFFSGMFQKEVAQRICEPSGSKKYGILSVLCQLFFITTYLFSVSPQVFNPKPKVESGVIQMRRKENFYLNCNEKLLFKIIKTSFQQRRKTLRNSLKTLSLPKNITEDSIFDLRPESLNCEAFVKLTKMIENVKLSNS
jgi:16S rRNA (adenine1518-N6/adenine1519-N6)-dimethyltransferase